MYSCYESLIIVLVWVDLFSYCCGEGCPSLIDRGPVCSDFTALNELNILVDDRIGDGCYCDVRVVNRSDNSYMTSVDSPGGIDRCGYSVDVTHTGPPVTFTCNKLNPFFMYVKQGDIIKLHFKREVSESYESPNFCIRVESRASIQNVRFAINCTRLDFLNTSTTPPLLLPVRTLPPTTIRLSCTLQDWIIYIGTAGGIVFILIIIIIILSCIILQKEDRYNELEFRLNVAETKVNTDIDHPTYDHNNIIPDATYDMDDGETEHTFQLGVPDADDHPVITGFPNYGGEPNTLKPI